MGALVDELHVTLRTRCFDRNNSALYFKKPSAIALVTWNRLVYAVCDVVEYQQ